MSPVPLYLAMTLTESSSAGEVEDSSAFNLVHRTQHDRRVLLTLEGPFESGRCAANVPENATPHGLAVEVQRGCGLSDLEILDVDDYAHLVPSDPAARVLDRTIQLTAGVRPFEQVAAELTRALAATLGPDEPTFSTPDGSVGSTRPGTRVEVPSAGPMSARSWLHAMRPLPSPGAWASGSDEARVIWRLAELPPNRSLILGVVERMDDPDDEDWGPERWPDPTRLEFLRQVLLLKETAPDRPSYGPAERARDIAALERLIAEERSRTGAGGSDP